MDRLLDFSPEAQIEENMKVFQIHPFAQAEYEACLKYYTAHALSIHAAEDFCMEIEEALSAIAAYPLRYRFVEKKQPERRFGPTKKFRFVIYYRVEARRLLILAIAHPRRKPGYWAARKA